MTDNKKKLNRSSKNHDLHFQEKGKKGTNEAEGIDLQFLRFM